MGFVLQKVVQRFERASERARSLQFPARVFCLPWDAAWSVTAGMGILRPAIWAYHRDSGPDYKLGSAFLGWVPKPLSGWAALPSHSASGTGLC